MAIFSLGHSALDITDLSDAIRYVPNPVIVDIRQDPSSGYDWLRRASLESWLPGCGVQYSWWFALAGWAERHNNLSDMFGAYGVDLSVYGCQKPSVIGPPSAKWDSIDLFDYSYYTMTDSFLTAADELRRRSESGENLILMSMASFWPKCRRAIIADYLTHRGMDVVHLSPRYRKTKSPRCVVDSVGHRQFLADRMKLYDAPILDVWAGNQMPY